MNPQCTRDRRPAAGPHTQRQPAGATAGVIQAPAEGTCDVVTRDNDFANGFRRLACGPFGLEPASHTIVAALAEPERMEQIDREAQAVYASPLYFDEMAKRYKGSTKVTVMPTARSQATVDEMVFQYTFA